MKKFLFDTNTVSTLTQHHAVYHQIMIDRLALYSLTDNDFCISIATIYEMEYGAKHATDTDLAQGMRLAIETIKRRFPILQLTEEGAKIFADIKEGYQQETQIGKKALIKHNIDFMIAAMEHNATVISNDYKMFASIQKNYPRFQWEDWTK